MSRTVEIKIPDIGDFTDVPIIEVLVQEGDRVEQEQSLVTLESDKATMEVPSPVAGVIEELCVDTESTVSEGSLIAIARVDDEEEEDRAGNGGTGSESAEEAEETDAEKESGEKARGSGEDEGKAEAGDDSREGAGEAAEEKDERSSEEEGNHRETGDREYDFDLVVVGAGPGGYSAAFRAADLGLRVALIERYPTLGGVCLNVGCIPSKTLLHTASVIDQAASMASHGVRFGDPEIDLEKLREFKNGVVRKLTGGLAKMAEQRKVELIQGTAAFSGPHEVTVEGDSDQGTVNFRHAIIAVGSRTARLKGVPWDDPRVMDSTRALELEEIPERLLVIGGGIIGLELACVYEALGSRISVVELTPTLMPGTDPDLVKPLERRIGKRYAGIHLETRVAKIEAANDGLTAHFEGEHEGEEAFDRVLVAVGRTPNGECIGADSAGVHVSKRGFIHVDGRMRTNVPHIFAIGDVAGEPLLAHKATHEGRVAAEVCAGEKSAFEARVIPSVAYTDPEIAWAGVTEAQARDSELDYGVGKFPWSASGRALGNDRAEGFTKLLFEQKTRRIIGAGITGPNAGDLISECALAIEMGAEAQDLALTIHPHPTLSESIGMAAEAYEGTITDLYLPKKS